MQQGDNEWQEYATIVDSLAYTIKDLQPGNAYRFRVRAENVHGRSEASLCSDVVTINVNGGHNTVSNGVSAHLYNDHTETIEDSIDGSEIIVRQGGDFKARFALEEELGKGRFGVVHRVIERETGQVLAAKIVKCIKAKDKLKVKFTLPNVVRLKIFCFPQKCSRGTSVFYNQNIFFSIITNRSKRK